MSLRIPIAAGNWKMNLTSSEAESLALAMARGLAPSGAVEILLFPSHPLLSRLADVLEGTPIGVGGQDLHAAASGAHTGDVSAGQLLDAGCSWVLIGHSERRGDHQETDSVVTAKLAAAAEAGLLPVFCLGETLEERQNDRTLEVLDRQLTSIVAVAPSEMVLAYEPVWAIGTGETATPEQAQEVHEFLRRRADELWGTSRSSALRILYGGSVKPSNAPDLIRCRDIDGFLVGGASLDAEKFLAIIHACGQSAA